MFVDITDFDGYPYNLPNLEKKINTFNSFVDGMEEDALVRLLGRDFWIAFKAALDLEDLEANPVVEVEAKYKLLRDGGDYTIGSTTYKWIGLKKLLTPYIYAEWIRAGAIKMSGIGAIQPQAENGIVVSPNDAIVKGWNDYVDLLGFDKYETPTTEHTLYGLLNSNSDYPDYDYNYPGKINVLGL